MSRVPRGREIDDHVIRDAQLAARRRLVLLGAVTAAALVPMALGWWQAWPLLSVPLAVAMVLAGPAGLALTAGVAALALALVSGNPEADDGTLLAGFVAFVAVGALIGVRMRSLIDDLGHASVASLTDRLTGLPNYAFLSEALPHELRRADRYGLPVSLVLLDLDGFKAFNDLHGHEAGNRMLAAVGAAMLAHSRGSDVVGRFGGEEFAVIVPGPLDEAVEAAERLRHAVARVRIAVGGEAEVGITTSAGVAEHWRGEAAEALVERADGALYAAKHAGRDRVAAVRGPRDELAVRRVA